MRLGAAPDYAPFSASTAPDSAPLRESTAPLSIPPLARSKLGLLIEGNAPLLSQLYCQTNLQLRAEGTLELVRILWSFHR